MKRDMDLVRLILFAFVQRGDVTIVRSNEIRVEGYEQRVVICHVNRMCEAGLLSCEKLISKSTPDRLVDAHPFRLSWESHEFPRRSKRRFVMGDSQSDLRGTTVCH